MVSYLYGDALQRQEKVNNKQKNYDQNIQIESNKSKIGLKSQKIVMKKIESTLNLLIQEIEEKADCINFQNLGHFLEQLGVFRALRFKKTDNNETSLYLHDR